MRAKMTAAFAASSLILNGCSTPPRSSVLTVPTPIALQPASSAPPTGSVVQASYTANAQNDAIAPPAHATYPVVGLPELIGMAVERNPRLAQVGWAVETARGRAAQAGLYPNPTVSMTGDELGDRTGPGGIWTTPMVSQEVVTANKLSLSKAATLKEVDQAMLAVITERYRLFTEVRQNFFEVVVLQRRAEVLGELVGLAEKSVDNANKLLKAKEVSDLDVVQLEVDLERYRADLDATKKSVPAAYRRLAASVGFKDLPYAPVVNDLETNLPDYDLDRVRSYVVGVHPEIRSAQIGVERAQLVLRRAEVEPIPNLTVSTGYTRQNQNRSDDWNIGVGLPVPLWNRNQGNIHAAKAQVGEAVNAVGRVENDLVGRLAASFAAYTAAKKRAERYKSAILPKAEQSYQLSLKAYQGGQFEYLRVLQAQRAVAEARLEHLRSLSEAWRAASEIAGFMLEDQWPPPPAAMVPEGKQP